MPQNAHLLLQNPYMQHPRLWVMQGAGDLGEVQSREHHQNSSGAQLVW